MENQRDSFIFYRSFYEAISDLSQKDQLATYQGITEFSLNGKIPELSKKAQTIFTLIKPYLDGTFKNIESGPGHWNWKGGITPENQSIRSGNKIKHWRNDVFERDEYTCQYCGQKGGELQAHHIKHFATHPELRFDVDNGLTLCKPCHKEEHSTKGDQDGK